MDASSLTASLGYDGCISEMYSAWVSGCAVVMLTKEEIGSGPDLVPVLREAEVTVLFCPPALLSTLTSTPEVDLPYPLCRYIVPAGEAFPSALVEPWTRCRRQVINTYGPTEASTDTSRQSLRPGEPITLGLPFANVTYVILEIGGLRPLVHGEVGELCIGGLHLARGYRNLPEQTAQKFIAHPQFGRLYRTGDKCKIDAQTLRVHFLGRIDAQLKVRGHRVEAQAVEDILQTQFSEIEAAVLDYQNEALVAFVMAPSIFARGASAVAPAPDEWAARVRATLAKQLPPPSVPTRIVLVEKFVMKPVSGKIDRKRLPDLSLLPRNGVLETSVMAQASKRGEAMRTDADAALGQGTEEVLRICRSVFETPIGWDDGFAKAGGHSIVIARLARRLQSAGWAVSVRALLSDCNTARKVASRKRQVQSPAAAAAAAAAEKFAKTSAPRDENAAKVMSVGRFTVLQVLFAALLYSPGLLASLDVLTSVDIGTFFVTGSIWTFMVAGIGLYLLGLLLPFACLLWVMCIKFFLGGDIYRNHVTPGVYPKWSKMHLRVWCIERMESLVVLPLRAIYRSAPLMAFALRQLGAAVGRNLQCASDAYLLGPIDLIVIEDDVAIQTGAYVQTTRWSEQNLIVGPIHLESGCKIGMRAAVANNVRVGRGSWITPFTPILRDVGAHEIWVGAPASFAGRCTELRRTANACRDTYPIWLSEACNVFMQIAVFSAISVAPAAAILWFARDLTPVAGASSSYFSVAPLYEIIGYLTLSTFITAWLTILVTSLLACLFIRYTAASPGLHSTCGLSGALLMYRMRMLNNIQRLWTWTITGQYLRALAGMHFTRWGASECDLMYNLVPEAASAGAQVFWSNGCFTNMLDYGAKHLTLRHLDMPRNYFSGNNSVAEYGQLPTNFVLGVSTSCSEIDFRRQMRSRLGEPITVAGNPPLKFASAEAESRQLPAFPLFLIRILLNDFFGIGMLPVTEGLIFATLYIGSLRIGFGPLIGALLALLLTEANLVLLSVVTKKVLVGRDWGSNHTTPFWSLRHFAYFFAQDCFTVWCQGLLYICAGTILANPILRWMGCQIGQRTIVTEPMQCFDWNAVKIDDNCVVGGFLQYHTFENMILKVKQTHIQDGCAISSSSTVMGGAVIERDTTLLPLSLVLKDMRLFSATYEGSPAEPVWGAMGLVSARVG
jgi:non-ribosomal peptide synthetase-like protein